MKSPAFQFYPDDFVGGTCDLSQAEVGAYMRLLCYQWGRGEIPTDREKLERIAGGTVSEDVLAKFIMGKNQRMESERAKQADYREIQRKKGEAGAQARWGKNGTGHPSAIAQALPKQCPDDGSPSPSPSPSPVPISDTILPPASPPRAEKKTRAPELSEVLEYAKSPTGNIDPLVAETWYSDHAARPRHATGGFTDKSGLQVWDWKQALRGFSLRWKNNDAQRVNGNSRRPAQPDEPAFMPPPAKLTRKLNLAKPGEIFPKLASQQ